MNTKNLLLSGLAGGLITAILTNVPYVSLLAMLCCVSFWIGPLFAVWLYRRMQGQVTLSQGLGVGAVAGAIAGLIGFILSFFNLAGVGDMAETLNAMPGMQPQDLEQMQALFSGPMVVLFNLIGAFITFAFGVIGGVIGGAAFKSKQTVTPDFMPPGTV